MEKKMTDHPIDPKMLSRLKDLQAQRTEIFSLPAADALNRILDSDQPAALVHCFPEEDLYFLIHDIGTEDALPLLSLASDRQCEYILDLETWDRDRVDIHQTTNWMDLMLRSNPDRFVQWFAEQQAEMLEFYLFKTIELKTREHDQHPDDLGDDFFTDDDVYYIRHRDRPFGTVEEDLFQQQRAVFLATFLKQLSAYDHIRFQQILLESAVVTPAEYEEEAFRLRNVRLAEKGFLPFDEAIGIYQPLNPAELKHRDYKIMARREAAGRPLPVPLYSKMIGTENLFSRSLETLKFDTEIYSQLQVEFAGLSNSIIIADKKTIRERDQLKNIVKKACGYISIGLEQIRQDRADENISPSDIGAALLKQYPLADFFRIGYGAALKLKWQARKWQADSWFARQGFPLAFWDEHWLGTMGGLLLKKPVFFDNYKTGELYREFATLEDIQSSRGKLDQIMAMDDLFDRMKLLIRPSKRYFLTYKALLLTLWARDYLNLPEPDSNVLKTPVKVKNLAVDIHQFSLFFKALFNRGTDDKPLAPDKINNAMKELFVQWIAKKSRRTEHELAQDLGHTFEELFNELEAEYGRVAAGDMNPHYLHHFIIALNDSE